MEGNNYEAAMDALLKAHKGVLPGLDTYVCVVLSSSGAGLPVRLLVAELVALALVEIGADAVLAEPVASTPPVRLRMPANLLHQGGPVVLTELLERAVVSVN